MKKIAILQSNYIPWKGYFDMIAAVDEFILYDGMQYTRRDWRNKSVEEDIFVNMGVKLACFDYSGYPEHPQLWGEFTHGVTILDLLFNCGKDASRYMRYVG